MQLPKTPPRRKWRRQNEQDIGYKGSSHAKKNQQQSRHVNNATTKYIDAVGPVSMPYVHHADPPNHRHREITQPEATAAGHQRTMMTGRVEQADRTVLGYGRVDEHGSDVASVDFVRKRSVTDGCRVPPTSGWSRLAVCLRIGKLNRPRLLPGRYPDACSQQVSHGISTLNKKF